MTTGATGLEQALEQYRGGKLVVLVDSAEREAEGALTLVAEFVTPDAIAFMAQHGRGLICIAMTGERLDELKIPSVQGDISAPFAAPFTVPVEARYGVTTGISAQDRARTVRVLIDPHSGPADIAMPGHMFPLRVRPGGVLARAGQAEAAVDLARLAGLYPAGVLCAITHGTGLATPAEVRRFARRHGLVVVSIKDLIAHRLAREQLVTRVTQARLPTAYGDFEVYAYHSAIQPGEHLALTMGELEGAGAPLVFIREQCLAGDVLGSRRCDCGERTRRGLQAIASDGRGVLLYLRPEERGVGLHNDLRLFAQPTGGKRQPGEPHPGREYGVAVQMLRDMGVRRVRLTKDEIADAEELRLYGLEVERVKLPAVSATSGGRAAAGGPAVVSIGRRGRTPKTSPV